MTNKKRNPMTPAGFARLQEEYYWYKKVKRPETVQRVANAAAEGDRSENAEYIYGRKKLREIDRRMHYLSQLLSDAELVDPATLASSQVCFGATVVVLDENDQQRQWTIVGEGEADSKMATISWTSPVAKALLGKRIGDLVVVILPEGQQELEIIDLLFAGRSIKA